MAPKNNKNYTTPMPQINLVLGDLKEHVWTLSQTLYFVFETFGWILLFGTRRTEGSLNGRGCQLSMLAHKM